jgi:hypothetical protein
MKDRCVICGDETRYDVSDHIDLRAHYIEGVGQLCYSCALGAAYETAHKTCVSDKLIEKTPNDTELGEKVRDIYRSKKHM